MALINNVNNCNSFQSSNYIVLLSRFQCADSSNALQFINTECWEYSSYIGKEVFKCCNNINLIT